MNNIDSQAKNKIKRRNFFYYIGAAAVSSLVLTKFPFNIFTRGNRGSAGRSSSIKVSENPLAVKRSVNG